MSNYDIRILFLIFIFYSFLGWCYEVIKNLVTSKKMINRGFLIGPWIPIYGVGAVLMTVLLRGFTNNIILLFILCIILFSSLEYVTSFFMEKIFHARWWDYSKKKGNINGRICIVATIFFGFVGLIAMYYVDPFLVNFFKSTNGTLLTIITIILFILFLIDFILSFIIINSLKGTVNEIKKDNTEQITELVKEVLLGKNYPRRRIVSAFPNISIK